MSRFLLIRMLETGDVATIAVPALRHIQRKYKQAKVDVLTHSQGADIIRLAQPETQIINLPDNWWPDNLLRAMEAFLGLAETIIAQGYQKIINLDTAFMPCFLARFLKDAGEPVEGNILSISVQELIGQVQNQQLQPDYVNVTQNYMQSTYFGMIKWHTPWWQGDILVEKGYPEFYLKACCGWTDINMDMSIKVAADKALSRTNKTVISLAISTPEYPYPQQDKLVELLSDLDFEVNLINPLESIQKQLAQLQASDLLVTLAQGSFALAMTVNCPTLLLSGQLDPRILMPDFATEMSETLPGAESLCESIQSIFSEQTDV